MPRRPDDIDLLRLIEGDFELVGDVALRGGDVALRAELAHALESDAALAAAVRSAKAQRDELRRLPQPVLPRDFVAELDAFLAPSAPLVRLPSRRSGLVALPSWSRLAVAAAIGAVATGGVWFGSTMIREAVTRMRASAADAMAHVGDADPGSLSGDQVADGRNNRMGMSGSGSAEAGGSDDSTRPSTSDRSAALGMRSAVAMIVESNDPRMVERGLRRLVREQVGEKGALVRNFTTTEALAMASRIIDEDRLAQQSGLAQQSTRGAGQPGSDVADRAARTDAMPAAPAAGSGAAIGHMSPMSPVSQEAAAAQQAMLEQALAAMKRERNPATRAGAGADDPGDLPPLGRDRTQGDADETKPETLGALLAGSREAAPTPEAQLAFGDGDFTMTLSVPAEMLSPLLVELTYEAAVRGVTLQPLDVSERPSAMDALRWKQWVEAAHAAAGGGRIAVPIRIVPAQPRK